MKAEITIDAGHFGRNFTVEGELIEGKSREKSLMGLDCEVCNYSFKSDDCNCVVHFHKKQPLKEIAFDIYLFSKTPLTNMQPSNIVIFSHI